MSDELSGKRIAFLVANVGVEQVELERPWRAIQDAGGQPVLVAPADDDVQAMNHDTELGDTFHPDSTVNSVSADEFDGLVLPGGCVNPDKLRIEPDAMALVRAFASAGKPIAAICHGPWSLVETGAVKGKTLTSWPSLQTDVRNAGGEWRDDEVVTCEQQGFTLVTSRKPDDLDAFCATAVGVFARAS
ncbi:MAG TPA: type 1 glutamine amidotransferase domain-containing protein [Amycolatopsis sp.]|nr:type 1 glutamine amidotransferase domain-containing protein [Amycolatopsis sp.]